MSPWTGWLCVRASGTRRRSPTRRGRTGVSVGAGFQWGNWTLDLAYAHLWVHSLDYSETDASGIRSSVGNVSTGNSRNTVANIYSATIGYTF